MGAAVVVLLVVDDALDAAEVVDAAGDGDGALLLEPELLLGLLEEPHEQRVLQITHRHHEPLPLRSSSAAAHAAGPHHPHRHAPLRRHPSPRRRAPRRRR
ncbi:hypothetical protein EE612_036461 [Oryza sativa]|nr:hypothetical protein EE612_036461 [Oryza sativa]